MHWRDDKAALKLLWIHILVQVNYCLNRVSVSDPFKPAEPWHCSKVSLNSSGVRSSKFTHPRLRAICSTGYRVNPAAQAIIVKPMTFISPWNVGINSIANSNMNAGVNMTMHPKLERGILYGLLRSQYLYLSQIKATNSNISAMQYTTFSNSTISIKLKLQQRISKTN